MVSFYPGPSRVYPKVKRYLTDAYTENILSINHRSKEFEAVCKKAVVLLKKKLKIPSDYQVYFFSSATECWEVIAQSLVQQESLHLFNGAFGQRWYQYTANIHGKEKVRALAFDQEEALQADRMLHESPEVLCLTHNETSNGTCLPVKFLSETRKQLPHSVIAVDATSSMGGMALNIADADVWFASVQKCFGLPAGLAVMIYSPAAVTHARAVNNRNHYNSLLFADDMMQRWQTTHTPNVLGIYLLMRVMADVKEIGTIHKNVTARFNKWVNFFETKSEQLRLLIRNPEVRSHTVLAVEATPAIVEKIKVRAARKGLILGNGYGALKDTTFRIANFPALRKSEIARLIDFLYDYI
jgi:phosphoserine aminotransferase